MKIGLLTSGGDCQALNAAMRGIAKALYEKIENVEIYGIEDGFEGFCRGQYREMSKEDFSGILTLGGTILGSSRMPFKFINKPDDDGNDKVALMVSTYKKMNLDCLVILGGNGSHKTANLLSEKGLNIITLPKTIDNDIFGTDMSFGFNSALEIATDSLDKIHTTASSHSRVFIVEIMGHKTGWLTLNAGIAGGADVILLPELPYDAQNIVEKIAEREKSGRRYTIIACAEGAISKADSELSKKDYKKKMGDISISFHLAAELRMLTGKEIRVVILGHTQRGGEPCAYDRILATRLGSKAAEFILERKFGVMVALQNEEIVAVPLSEVAGKLKTVPVNSEVIEQAQRIGVCFG